MWTKNKKPGRNPWMRIGLLMQTSQKSPTLFTNKGKRCILFLFGIDIFPWKKGKKWNQCMILTHMFSMRLRSATCIPSEFGWIWISGNPGRGRAFLYNRSAGRQKASGNRVAVRFCLLSCKERGCEQWTKRSPRRRSEIMRSFSTGNVSFFHVTPTCRRKNSIACSATARCMPWERIAAGTPFSWKMGWKVVRCACFRTCGRIMMRCWRVW